MGALGSLLGALGSLLGGHGEPRGPEEQRARNIMRDEMSIGDMVLFYHSNCKEPGIVGLMEIASEAYTDHTAFDKDEKYFDAKSDPENPRWLMLDVKYIRHTKRNITLSELREHKKIEDMRLLQKGNRLSVIPMKKSEWDYILGLE